MSMPSMLTLSMNAPLTAHRVCVILEHRDAVGRGRLLHRLRAEEEGRTAGPVNDRSANAVTSNLDQSPKAGQQNDGCKLVETEGQQK